MTNSARTQPRLRLKWTTRGTGRTMRGRSKSEVATPARVGLWIALLLLICALTPVANAAKPLKSGYDVTILPDFNAPADLPVPPQGSAAFGMNNSGDVVGWSYYSRTHPSISAFLYRNGQLTRLGQLKRAPKTAGPMRSTTTASLSEARSGPSFSQEFPFVWQVEAMLTTRPKPRSIIPGSTAWLALTAPMRWTSHILLNSAGSDLVNGPGLRPILHC